jgi:hypothetical protein
MPPLTINFLFLAILIAVYFKSGKISFPNTTRNRTVSSYFRKAGSLVISKVFVIFFLLVVIKRYTEANRNIVVSTAV